MFESVDVLIGLTVIMLALSMVVTVFTQFLTTVLNSRGRHLKRSLADLIQQVDPNLDEDTAKKIARKVLMHPLISGAKGGMTRLGSVILREEFIKMLLDLAHRTEGHRLDEKTRMALKTSLAAGGIADPADTLKRVRSSTLALEEARPDLALNVRQSMAILQEAKSEFVAFVNGWFDQTMDRATQRFTFSTRAVTLVGATVVALALQLDTVALVNRLSQDAEIRQVLVKTAELQATAAQGEATASPKAQAESQMQWLASHGLIAIPKDLGDWQKRWADANAPGIAVTVILLSLGAPFWYSMLGRLLKLRSVLAEKDDQHRAKRQHAAPLRATRRR